MNGMRKDLERLVRDAREQGFGVELTAGSHVRFVPPDVRFPPIFTGSTPGDQRSIRNLRARLRRSGFRDGARA